MNEQQNQRIATGAVNRRSLLVAALLAVFATLLFVGVRASTALFGRSGATGAAAARTESADYVPRELIVGHRAGISDTQVLAEVQSATGWRVSRSAVSSGAANEVVVKLPASVSVTAAASRVAKLAGIRYADPNYIAHMAGGWYPNDVGTSSQVSGWKRLQWNFLDSKAGVDAPDAWRTLIRDGRAGAKGVTIAVLDTGIAYRNWNGYKRSPDFSATTFVDPCDLVLGTVVNGRCTDQYALDRNGHGTFVAGTIAESTNNGIGLTGLAYNASVMPVRVLDASGEGNAATIALGIRYAVAHHAKVINLSIEFSPGTAANQIPSLISAIGYAYRHGVTVVAASGNDSTSAIAYPADDRQTISVGATTADGCLAIYSNTGSDLDLVAPGGGDDAHLKSANCHPTRNLPGVYQMTFNNGAAPDKFSLPNGWWGTSMATPDVSAAAAMVIASGVIGRNPSPDQILAQLRYTAVPLGTTTPNADYGYGLLDIGAAVSETATAANGAAIRQATNGSRSVIDR